MAMAPVIYTLWQRFLRFDPNDPTWPARDRFVLSIAHASMLLYAMLYLTRVKAVNPPYEQLGDDAVTLEDIRRFRQFDSRCPGHPEYRWTSGVETTTGPLGQGVSTAVDMAIAAQWQAASCGGVAAWCRHGCSTWRRSYSSSNRISRSFQAVSQTRAKAAGLSMQPSTPAPVLSAVLYQRFSSRGKDLFTSKVLSAMRYEFGGHIERPAGE